MRFIIIINNSFKPTTKVRGPGDRGPSHARAAVRRGPGPASLKLIMLFDNEHNSINYC